MKKLFLFAAALSLALPAMAEVPRTLRACGDAAEFAPFQYFEREAGRRTERVVGFDVDLLRRIMADAGREVQIDMLPWTRCLVLAAQGDFDIAMDGIKSPARERDFLMAAPHYALIPVFIYLKSRPKPALGSRKALAGERVCSQAGYNYAPYGVPNEMIRNRARTLDDAAAMLKLGRCSVMLQEVEILRANATLGGIDLMGGAEFEHEFPSWVGQIPFHFMVSRKLPHRIELLALLDAGIARLKKSGELERLRNAHVAPEVR